MSAEVRSHRLSVQKLRARKGETPIVCLTAYTAPLARLIDPLVDVILVGDSLGQVVHGLPTTVPVPLDLMIAHGRAVMRGSQTALVAVDLPFGAYEESPQAAFRSAARVLKETGAQAVKLEGGVAMAETIAFLTARGVPVIGHVGLLPQAVNLTGYRTRGRVKADWAPVIADAKAVAEAGAFLIVLEGVAAPLAEKITRALATPTIGIGASAACDGQILVLDDLLGLLPQSPSFVKRYAELGEAAAAAVASFAADVRARRFPALAQTYGMREEPPVAIASRSRKR